MPQCVLAIGDSGISLTPQSCCDSRQGVDAVAGASAFLESRDHRLPRAHLLGERLLGQAGPDAEVVDEFDPTSSRGRPDAAPRPSGARGRERSGLPTDAVELWILAPACRPGWVDRSVLCGDLQSRVIAATLPNAVPTERRSGHSRFIIARASFSTSMNWSPETSTITCLMVPPVNAQGRSPG